MDKPIKIAQGLVEWTKQDLFTYHQAFNLIQTSQNPMWKAVALLEKKKIKAFYDAQGPDRIPNKAKINLMIKTLNEMQKEWMETDENGQPKMDTTKEPVNGQPVFLLKEGKTIGEFNEMTSALLAETVIIKIP